MFTRNDPVNGNLSSKWTRRAWLTLAACAFVVALAAALFRIDGVLSLANEPMASILYCAMIAAMLLGLLCFAFLLVEHGVRGYKRWLRR